MPALDFGLPFPGCQRARARFIRKCPIVDCARRLTSAQMPGPKLRPCHTKQKAAVVSSAARTVSAALKSNIPPTTNKASDWPVPASDAALGPWTEL